MLLRGFSANRVLCRAGHQFRRIDGGSSNHGNLLESKIQHREMVGQRILDEYRFGIPHQEENNREKVSPSCKDFWRLDFLQVGNLQRCIIIFWLACCLDVLV